MRLCVIWKDGEVRRYSSNTSGFTVEARCIDKEDFKITRTDAFCVLFHTSSKPEHNATLRNLIADHNLTELVEELV